jgi:hypothetical protein
MNHFERALAAKIMIGKNVFDELFHEERIAVALELTEAKLSKPQKSSDYLIYSPRFCLFLFNEAKNKSLSIQHFIEEDILGGIVNMDAFLLNLLNQINYKHQEKNITRILEITEDVKNEIYATDLIKLNKACEWLLNEMTGIITTTQKLIDFKAIKLAEEESIMPDHEEIDRLMRYQTTIQRQLSTAIGELLALTKLP